MTVNEALMAAKRLSAAGYDVRLTIAHRKNRNPSVRHDGPPTVAEVYVPIREYSDLDYLTQKRKELRDMGYRAEWDGSSEFDITLGL
jgi:hypothetical protein